MLIKENILTRFMPKESMLTFATKMVILLSLAVMAPFLHFQALTGTIVNATLFVAAVILGRKDAIFIGVFPSVISIVFGILSPAILPLIPFIIFGNTILIFIFSFIRKESYCKAVAIGSFFKFAFLYLSGLILAASLGNSAFAKIAVTMFSWQQLLTALSGGIVAYATLKILKKV